MSSKRMDDGWIGSGKWIMKGWIVSEWMMNNGWIKGT